MIVLFKLANLLAKCSCPKWNRCGILRRLCRYSMWGLTAIDYMLLSPSSILRIAKRTSYFRHRNTYPRIYYCIANWPEDDGALVVDPSNFVIKHSTSYCAWKIRELTGKWPKNAVNPKDESHAIEIANRERPHDAKYWLEFLQAQDCYLGITDLLRLGHHYIGINPNYGEYGLVVWLESLTTDATEVTISTYEHHRYTCKNVSLVDFTWVEIHSKAISD